jgi:predicted RNA binding protein YcfA (HicA-like mRNA interferase family)
MGSLPALSGSDVAKAFAKGGWQMVRQRGSHIILVKDGHMATLSVPDHREVAKGTLRSLIRSSGLTVEEFSALAGK